MKNKIIIALIVLTSLSSVGNLKAQQDVQFTHYMYNTLAVNPAYAGNHGMLDASLLYRKQWMGINGAPTSQTFFMHSPLRIPNMGVGLSLVNDIVGPIRQTSISGDYSYTIQINDKGHKLAFGLKGGMNIINASLADVKTNDQSDEAFTSVQKAAPNFGGGLYYHTDKWYFGASIPKFLQTKIENTGSITPTKFIRHYYFLGGYVFELNQKLKLKPASMFKITQNAPLSIDVSAEIFYMDKVSAGLMHRVGDSFGVLMGYQFTPQLRTGISYDYSSTKLRNFNSGTVELFLSYDFVFKGDKIITPRFF